MSFRQEHVLQVIRNRREAIVDRWLRAVAWAGFTTLNLATLRQRLGDLLDQITTIVCSKGFDPYQARGIGVNLAQLYYTPPAEALGRSLEVLAQELVAELPPSQAVLLQPRIATIMNMIATGFFTHATKTILAEQEQIRHALLIERDRATEALRASQELLRTVASSIPIVLFAFDREGVFTLVEGRGLASVGLQPGDIIGRSVFDMYQHVPALIEWANRALGGDTSRTMTSDNGVVFEHWGTPLRNAEGELIGVSGVAVDITEQKQAEAAMWRTQTFLTSIIDNLPHMIFVKDAEELRFVLMNRSGEELVGHTEAELVGKNDYDFFPPEEADFFTTKDREVLRAGILADIPEETIQTRYRGMRILHTKKIPVLDMDGRPLYLLGISEDITERKRAEEQRRAIERKLQETQKIESLGLLIGGVAHDFGNLFAVILGNAGLALMELPPDSPARVTLDRVAKGTRHAAELSRQLLAYAGKGRARIELLNLNTVVEELGALLRASIPRLVTLQCDLAPQLPAVEVDVTQVHQVVLNLIINAADAIGSGEGTITLTTRMAHVDQAYVAEAHLSDDLPEGPYVAVEVADTGCGMDEATQARIFEPFFTTKANGHGLGLAAVLGIIRNHGGALRVQSVVGAGTIMTVLLPASLTMNDFHPIASQDGVAWRGKGTVLVVDDEEPVRAVVTQLLERFGFAVLAASNGRAGVEIFTVYADVIDVVLLDIAMPYMNGDEAFRLIRRVRPDARVVLMSSYSKEEISGRVQADGYVSMLQKPFSPAELRASLRQILEADSARE